MNNVVIVDNCIDEELQNILEKEMLSDNFAWFYKPNAAYSDVDISKLNMPIFPNNSKDSCQFTHNFYYNNNQSSNYFNLIIPVLSAIPATIKNLLRVKANLKTYNKDDVEFIGLPHVDYANPSNDAMTAIYYVNDSFGETIIYNEEYGHIGELTVKEKIAPKKGRLAFFHSKFFHSSNTPKNSIPRMVINFNLIKHI